MRLAGFVVALAFLTACGGSAGNTDSGIRGQAFVGPACPVEPCQVPNPPYTGLFLVRQEGAIVAKVRTDGKGQFEVRLAPGRYVLVSDEAEALPLLKPVEVTVREGEFSDVTLGFESGIR